MASGGCCEYLKLATGGQRPATGETLLSKAVATAIVWHVQVLCERAKPCKVPPKAKGTRPKTGHYNTGHPAKLGKSCAAKNGSAELRSPASRVEALKKTARWPPKHAH